jgi:hypothetical protein
MSLYRKSLYRGGYNVGWALSLEEDIDKVTTSSPDWAQCL